MSPIRVLSTDNEKGVLFLIILWISGIVVAGSSC